MFDMSITLNWSNNILEQAYDHNMRQVGALCEQEGIVFVPLPVEKFGGWGKGAVKEIQRIGSALAGRGYLSPHSETECVTTVW